MNLLLTGGTGLIGRELLSLLVPEHTVWAITRPGSATPLPARCIAHDLAGPALPAELPPRIDAVVHLAQSPHFREFPQAALDIFEVNVGSTLRLLDWARSTGAQRFIYASSGGVYGHGDKEFIETDGIDAKRPLGFYLASKQSAELLAENYASVFTVVILRLFFVYGRAQRPTMLIPRLVRAVADGTPIVLHGRDGLRLNPIHVGEAALSILRALDLSESQKINIGGPEVLSLRQVGQAIGSHLGKEPRFDVQESIRPTNVLGDIAKMTHLLGAPRIRFTQGVRELCEAWEMDPAAAASSSQQP